MPTQPQKPTIILASGSWYPASSFDPLAVVLQKHGYRTRNIAWPSITHATQVKSLEDDIAVLRGVIQPETAAGRDVVVLAHSWAGMPVNSGLGGLIKSETGGNEGKGGGNGVVKLLFIAAFMTEDGQSLVSTFGGEAEWYVKDTVNATISPSTPFDLFFHDVPDGREWASTLRPAAWSTTIAPATGAAYLSLPSAYLFCEEDRALPLFLQQAMVDKARSNGADVRSESVRTGHSPWLVEGGAERVAEWVMREV
ncbi:alpha/beta hydrolase [Aspergillus undulatus]|uniref:alpha/beta hydrolase n=1 Tax=Aspergillus undulatus TaxID=1810928 RepID=UPI003CCDBCD0